MVRALLIGGVLITHAIACGEESIRDIAIQEGKRYQQKRIESQEYLIRCEEAKEAAIKSAKPSRDRQRGQPAEITRDRVPTQKIPQYRFLYSTAKQKKDELEVVRRRIEDMKAELARLHEELNEEDFLIVAKLDCRELKVGQLGIICYDGKNPIQGKVIQVVDSENVIVEWSSRPHWVRMPTTGLFDGQDLVMGDPVYIKGTKQYTTVLGGTKTVLEVHAVDLSE
jgi:hypothetical protein